MAKSTNKVPAKKAKGTSKNQLLGIIAQLAPLHGGKPPRDLVAKQAGYGSGTNPSYKKALLRASKRDHVDLSDKEVVGLTDAGLNEAGDVPDPPSNEEAQGKIREELTPAMRKVFDLIQDGKPYKRTFIASEMDYPNEKVQGFKKLIDRIRLKGYLECVDKEHVQLSNLCFPCGRGDTNAE